MEFHGASSLCHGTRSLSLPLHRHLQHPILPGFCIDRKLQTQHWVALSCPTKWALRNAERDHCWCDNDRRSMYSSEIEATSSFKSSKTWGWHLAAAAERYQLQNLTVLSKEPVTSISVKGWRSKQPWTMTTMTSLCPLHVPPMFSPYAGLTTGHAPLSRGKAAAAPVGHCAAQRSPAAHKGPSPSSGKNEQNTFFLFSEYLVSALQLNWIKPINICLRPTLQVEKPRSSLQIIYFIHLHSSSFHFQHCPAMSGCPASSLGCGNEEET